MNRVNAKQDCPGLIEAMARHTSLIHVPADLSVGITEGWIIDTFDAEATLRDYMETNAHEAFTCLFGLIEDKQGEIVNLYLSVNSDTAMDTLTDMREKMDRKFIAAINHEFNYFMTDVRVIAAEAKIEKDAENAIAAINANSADDIDWDSKYSDVQFFKKTAA